MSGWQWCSRDPWTGSLSPSPWSLVTTKRRDLSSAATFHLCSKRHRFRKTAASFSARRGRRLSCGICRLGSYGAVRVGGCQNYGPLFGSRVPQKDHNFDNHPCVFFCFNDADTPHESNVLATAARINQILVLSTPESWRPPKSCHSWEVHGHL